MMFSIRNKSSKKFKKNDFLIFYFKKIHKNKMDCSICSEDFNSKLKSVQCPANDKCPLVCVTCFLKFATDNFTPSCMHCKSEITKDFIRSIVNKKKFNEYNNSKFLMTFDRQKSLLPQTVEIIEKEKEIHKLRVELYDNRRIYETLRLKIRIFRKANPKILKPTKKHPERADVYNNYQKLIYKQRKLNQKMENIESEIDLLSMKTDQPVKKEFVMNCPLDGCRGFLSSAYKCGLCENYFCSDCNHKKDDRNDENHVCDENDKASVAFLKTKTKKCPKCGVHISKIDGCDQMYCVAESCMTFFSWITGKIDEGPRHNPEYFRFLRERGMVIPPSQPIANNDDACINYFSIERRYNYNTYNNLRTSMTSFGVKYEDWEYYYRRGVEIIGVIIDLPATIGDVDGEQLRKKYLLKQIDEDRWKKNLKRILKKNEKNYEIRQILELYLIGINEDFKKFIRNLRDNRVECVREFSEILNDFKLSNKNLVSYINLEIKKIMKKYDSVDRKFLI